MIPELEQQTKQHPRGVCFLFEGRTFVNAQVRLQAAGLARALQLRGVRRGSLVACDMDNCPALVLLAAAAGYGGFTLVPLNRRLTAAEKAERLDDLERSGYHIMVRLDEPTVVSMLREVSEDRARRALRHHAERFAGQFNIDERAVVMFTSGTSGRAKAVGLTWRNLVESALASNEHLGSSPADVWQLALPLYHIGGFQVMVRSIVGRCSFVLYRTFDARTVLDDAMRYAVTHISVVDKMLQDLIACAEGAEAEDEQTCVRGAHARLPHEADEPAEGSEPPMPRGRHAARIQAVPLHARVEDLPSLRRFATVADSARALAGYRCVLLGGAAPNPRTLEDALAAGARVYASYGMTETASQMASVLVEEGYAGKLALLPGYEATVVAPDAEGQGQLAVKGPGVFAGYLNAQAAFTADGFFLTGDRARVDGRTVQVAERTDDMFVSGGENVYPAEIQRKLLYVPGVTDAYVFGVLDPVWGRRPVAVVERSPRAVRQAVQRVLQASERRVRDPYGNVADLGVRPGLAATGSFSPVPASEPAEPESDARLEPGASVQRFAEGVAAALEGSLARVYRPDRVLVVEEFPRTGIGKVDRAALRKLFDERIEVRRVEVYRIKQPFVQPIRTAKTVLEERESLIVRVVDHAGRTGIGEGVAFSTDWYLPETIDQDMEALENELVPRILAGVYAHPRDVLAALAECPAAGDHPLACGALEPALWDLYGAIVRKPLWQLIGGAPWASPVCGGVQEVESSDGGEAGTACVPESVVIDPIRECDAETAGDGSCEVPPTASVPGGAVFGLLPVDQLVAAVGKAVAQGFARVKIKIAPGQDVEPVRAVREAFPDVTIMVDANQSYADAREAAKAIDQMGEHGIRCIEEPLAPNAGEDHAVLFKRLANLQELVDVPICLDESVATNDDLRCALQYPNLRCYAVKIAKLGGVSAALSFCEWAERHGVDVWMGGMYDLGISKRLHAAFETLPSVAIPGDLSDTARYFSHDVTVPAFRLLNGRVELNGSGHEAGLGCALDEEVLERLTVEKRVYERS